MCSGCRFESYLSDAVGSFPNMQVLSVFPAEIIKMLALVDCFPMQKTIQKRGRYRESPNCGDRNTTVKDSRKVEMNVFRTRYCNKCGNTFYTEEISIDNEETVRAYMSAIERERRNK